jgi:hypothetical protein
MNGSAEMLLLAGGLARRVDPQGESLRNVNTPADLAGLDPSEAASA